MKRTFKTTLMAILLCVCMVFGFTGCVNQEDIDNAVNSATAPLNEQITTLEADIAEKEIKIATLETEKAALISEKEALEAEIAALETSNGTLTAEKAALNARVNELEASISAKDAEIAELEAEKKTLTDRVAELEDENKKLEDEKSELEKENAGLKNCLKGNHIYVDGVCPCGLIDATEMTAEQLNTAIAKVLLAGYTDIEVTLAPDAPAEMITAIRRAICDTEGIAEGSINLTLKGVISIPDDYNSEGIAFGQRNAQWDENGVEIVSHENVTRLASVNLPDVLTIGNQAFGECINLTSITVPKVQTVGERAFMNTKLTSVELPQATTIGSSAFLDCASLITVKLPSATSIGDRAFLVSENITDLELTAEGAITLGTSVFGIPSQNFSTKVNLVLHGNKLDEVNWLTWNGYTFKSITFVCADGTMNHSFTYTDNEDGTHDKVCTECGYVVDNEAHAYTYTSNGDGTHDRVCVCGEEVIEGCRGDEVTCGEQKTCEVCKTKYGEALAHIIDSETGYCDLGCGTLVAVVKVTLGDMTGYYSSLEDARNNVWENATVTLLQNVTNDYIEWSKLSYTFDLNGYTLNRGMLDLYASGDGKTVTLVNTGTERAYVGSVYVYSTGNVTFTVKENVDVGKIRLNNNEATIDLSAADFTSCQLNVTKSGCNTSQIILGSYAVYDADGNVVTGELTNGVTYTIKAAH